MRYILIDRIQRLEWNTHILALKNTTLAEDVYSDHFFGYPVMPGALLIESLAQAGTALLEVSADFKKKALLIIVDHAKFRALVRPGDQLTIALNVLSFGNDAVRMEGTIHVGERLVMNAQLTFTLKDADEYYPLKSRHVIEALYEFWLKDAELIGIPPTGESSHD